MKISLSRTSIHCSLFSPQRTSTLLSTFFFFGSRNRLRSNLISDLGALQAVDDSSRHMLTGDLQGEEQQSRC